MSTINGINLAEARELESHLLAIAERLRRKPVTVAVMDRAGDLVTLTRQDGAMPATIQVVISKGKTALAFDRDTIELKDWSPEKILNAKAAVPEFTTWGGATLIFRNGIFIGVAIVSGLTQEEDHELSRQRPDHWNGTKKPDLVYADPTRVPHGSASPSGGTPPPPMVQYPGS